MVRFNTNRNINFNSSNIFTMLKKRITEKDLVEKIGDEAIFNYYFGNFKIGKSYNSIFRKDTNPSTGFFYNKEGRLVYNDFATSESYGAISFIMRLYSLSYSEAIIKIASDFNLTKDKISAFKKPIVNIEKKKKEKFISIEVDNWNEENLDYWKQYTITKEELIQNKIYPVKKAFINNWEIPNEENLQRYGLLLQDIDNKEYIKLYTPLHPNKKRKWLNSGPLSVIIGLNKLEYKSDTLIICKSIKERIICLKFYTDVLSIQSENKGSLQKEVVDELFKKYKRIIFIGDNDEPGLKFIEYVKSLNIECYYFIDKLRDEYNIKDIGDFVKTFNIEYLKKYFKKYINLVVSK